MISKKHIFELRRKAAKSTAVLRTCAPPKAKKRALCSSDEGQEGSVDSIEEALENQGGDDTLKGDNNEQLKDNRSPINVTESRFHRGHRGNRSTVTSVAMHPRYPTLGLYSGGKDCCVISWDAETGRKRRVFRGVRKSMDSEGHTKDVTGVAGLWDHPDYGNNLIVSVGLDGKMLLWDHRTAAAAGSLYVDKPMSSEVVSTKFGATSVVIMQKADAFDVDEALISIDKGDLYRWPILGGGRLLNVEKGHVGRCQIVIQQYRKRPITCGDDKTVRLWNMEQGKHSLFDRHEGPVDAIAQLSPNDFVSGDSSGKLLVWNAVERRPSAQLRLPPGMPVTSLYSPGGFTSDLGAANYASVERSMAGTRPGDPDSLDNPIGPAAEEECPLEERLSSIFFAGSTKGRLMCFDLEKMSSRKRVASQLDFNFQGFDSKAHGKFDGSGGKGSGLINAMIASRCDDQPAENGKKAILLAAGIGRDNRLGRWDTESGACNGIGLVRVEIDL